jgi:DNA-binding protein
MAADDNVVYVGKKGIMSYVLAAITQFNQGSVTVSIKARGKSISRAVDVAEILRNKFMAEVKVQNIAIKTEELANEDGTKSKVSSIDITLAK